MGMVDKLRGIGNWQTVVVLCFYISAVLALAIVAIMYDIIWLIAACATTLGIVAGSLTTSAKTAVAAVTNNPGSSNEISKRDINDLRIVIAETRSELLLLKSQVGEINGE